MTKAEHGSRSNFSTLSRTAPTRSPSIRELPFWIVSLYRCCSCGPPRFSRCVGFADHTGILWMFMTRNNSELLLTSTEDHGATWAVVKDMQAIKPRNYGWIAPSFSGTQLKSGRLAVCADHIVGVACFDVPTIVAVDALRPSVACSAGVAVHTTHLRSENRRSLPPRFLLPDWRFPNRGTPPVFCHKDSIRSGWPPNGGE